MTTALEIRGLQVPFGEGPGLTGVSLTLARGERLALVGPSGSGKTSLLRAVAGSERISAGTVTVAGVDVTGLPPDRRGTVLLAQRPLLFPHLSVFENVAFPLRVRRIEGAEVTSRVRAALASVHVADLEGRSPSALSGGQAHRVALARAVVARPHVLLLDEPLSSLDPALREDVRRAILDVQAEYGPAMVLVTHDLEEAGRSAHRMAVLLGGGIAQAGTPRDVFRCPGSVQVARFLGLPNEGPGTLGPRGLRVAGWPVGPAGRVGERDNVGAGGRAGETRPVTVLFGPEAARLSFAQDGPGLPARVVAVLHHPRGITARVEVAAGYAPRARGGLVERAQAGSGSHLWEVAVESARVPEPGERVRFDLDPERVHVFDEAGRQLATERNL